MKIKRFSLSVLPAILCLVFLACSGKKTEEVADDIPKDELSGNILIWDWNGDIQMKFAENFNKIHPNVTVNVQEVAWDDYMTKLQTSYVTGLELPDIIFGEIAWRGALFEMGICENLEQAPYNLDRSLMVKSSVPLTSDPSDHIVAIDMQVTPAGFAYKRDVAKQYLGTDDPAEVGDMISDWDKFLEVGKKVSNASDGRVKMMASLGDVLLSTLSQNVVDYVSVSTVDITAKVKTPLEIALRMRDAGIIGNIEMYSSNWYAAYASKDILFYEAAAWCPPYVISVNDPDGSGNWAITTPPGGAFNLGGTSLSINKDSKNKAAAWEFIKYVYFSEEGSAMMYELTGNYSCYQPYYESEYSPFNIKGPYDDFFGGQSLVQFYIGTAAPQAKTAKQTRLDSIVDATWQKLIPVYMSNSSVNAAEALDMFIEEVKLRDPDITVK
ncbi:extracellular solute-binding protein [Treponema sp. TIM-1]|uniref:ABC transporter substrate-binding protein n=1 Tax=Treponema sp. TIM-1 TaxID=2898417 RepID=UPI0039811C71